ncbi:glycerophosphodiester phosphodiesterase [Desulfatiferula olefinivorans]
MIVLALAGFFTGCATPAYVRGLDRILAAQSLNNPGSLDYRCTAGAHRGASVDHLENTLDALVAADRDDRYAFVEFDVQYSGDNTIMVYHDKRMLRLHGRLASVGDTPASELREITAGDMPEYREVMDRLTKKVNIEIKSQGDEAEDARLVDEIVADIRARKRERDVMISSISKHVVAYVSDAYPDIPTGLVFFLTSSTYLPVDALTRNLFDSAREVRADYLILYKANLRNIGNLIRLKPKDMTIIFWDFDDTIVMIHKDLSDRLWGTSAAAGLYQALRYRLAGLFR